MSLATNDCKQRLLDKRESRRMGRLWGKGYGFLLKIRKELEPQLDAIYQSDMGNKPIK